MGGCTAPIALAVARRPCSPIGTTDVEFSNVTDNVASGDGIAHPVTVGSSNALGCRRGLQGGCKSQRARLCCAVWARHVGSWMRVKKGVGRPRT